MDASLGEKTTVGVLTAAILTVGVYLRKGFMWLIGIHQKLESHDEKFRLFETKLAEHIDAEESRTEKIDEALDRMARVEVKIDLLINKKIK